MKTNCIHRVLLVWLCVVALPLSCTTTKSASYSFQEEFDLTVKAGREKLSARDKQKLLDQNHPLLFQMANTQTFSVVKLFGNLPDSLHKELLKATYLKWKYTDLDRASQQVYRTVVQVTIDSEKQQGGTVQPGMSVEALGKSDVGFAVVEIPKSNKKVVSLYVIFPDALTPIWVTVVNSRAAGTMPYFQAHLQRLPMLKAMPNNELPK